MVTDAIVSQVTICLRTNEHVLVSLIMRKGSKFSGKRLEFNRGMNIYPKITLRTIGNCSVSLIYIIFVSVCGVPSVITEAEAGELLYIFNVFRNAMLDRRRIYSLPTLRLLVNNSTV